MDLFLTESWFVGGEARGTYLGDADYSLTSQARPSIGATESPRGDIISFNLLARVGIKFGA